MNYGQVKNQALKIMKQYSIAGSEIPASYNNQADYLVVIPGLVNEAMMEIATTVRKIPVVMNMSDLPSEQLGERQTRYTLPDDFYQFVSGDVLRTIDGHLIHTNHFMLQGKQYIIVPTCEAGDYEFTYYRYPRMLPESPEDTASLDNTPDTHLAIPYYVASKLLMTDDEFQCALCHNTWDDKLRNMQPDITSEAHQVCDVYGFDHYYI